MAKSPIRDLLIVATSALEGVSAQRASRHGMGAGPVLSQVAGIGLPVLTAALIGVPIKPTLIGAALGSAGSGLYDALSGRPATFLVWGNTHGRQTMHRAVVRKMAAEPGVDFGVFLGNAVDDAGKWRYQWEDSTRPLRERWRIFRLRGPLDDEEGYDRRLWHRMPMVLPLASGALYLINDDDGIDGLVAHANQTKGPVILCIPKAPLAFTAEGLGPAPGVARRLATLLARADAVICGGQTVFGHGRVGGAGVVCGAIAGSNVGECLHGAPNVEDCDPAVRGYLRVEVGETVSVKLVEVKTDDNVSVPQG